MIILENVKTEKYGRLLADIYLKDEPTTSIALWMMEQKLAVKYDGKKNCLQQTGWNIIVHNLFHEFAIVRLYISSVRALQSSASTYFGIQKYGMHFSVCGYFSSYIFL